jgi:hypothetical protein
MKANNQTRGGGEVSYRKAGTGSSRWAGLLVVNYRDGADWNNGRCKTELVDFEGGIAAVIHWSSRTVAAHGTTQAYNDLRELAARRDLTPDDVVRAFQMYTV